MIATSESTQLPRHFVPIFTYILQDPVTWLHFFCYFVNSPDEVWIDFIVSIEAYRNLVLNLLLYFYFLFLCQVFSREASYRDTAHPAANIRTYSIRTNVF
jgi:hypothetical protein